MRSSMPPWPGMRSPESFTPYRRFTADSNKSPHWPTKDSMTATATQLKPNRPPQRRPAPNQSDQGGDDAAADRSGPGLVGLTLGASRGPPSKRPTSMRPHPFPRSRPERRKPVSSPKLPRPAARPEPAEEAQHMAIQRQSPQRNRAQEGRRCVGDQDRKHTAKNREGCEWRRRCPPHDKSAAR